MKGLIARSEGNLAAIADWVEGNQRVRFLAEVPQTRSCTSICLVIAAPWFVKLDAEEQAKAAKAVAALLEKEKVALDAGAYRDAPPASTWAGRRWRHGYCRAAAVD